ncbi:hypothetical protein GUITHDRAFT_120498 [Guillardia theta CCMP2712]|uniref:PDZ domain-containing protein n=1 Tax=Guillardia theta (strain CCMP2712) TaxID=905079 RepID=L1IBQ3_GUITC|nr:hypothetical protein GUITHDRAFT_120498 [Guillardia theta CCMP2712]EKX33334.1 hypothetical protein GUITHDRAFT_120498 [Guillardia theta CCMP2712]|eukprot:XP_005820314.1 hypothetical protein GUITHDRAFT_120498 [Guillardia theta CCMP2712]
MQSHASSRPAPSLSSSSSSSVSMSSSIQQHPPAIPPPISAPSPSYFLFSNPAVFAHQTSQPSFVGNRGIYDAVPQSYTLSPRFIPPPSAGFFTPRYAASNNQAQTPRRRSDSSMPTVNAALKRTPEDREPPPPPISASDSMHKQRSMNPHPPHPPHLPPHHHPHYPHHDESHIVSNIISFKISYEEKSERDPLADESLSQEEQNNDDSREKEDIKRLWMKQQEMRMKHEHGQPSPAGLERHEEQWYHEETQEEKQEEQTRSPDSSRGKEQRPMSFHDKHYQAINHIKKTIAEVERVIGPLPPMGAGGPVSVVEAVHTLSFDEDGNLSEHGYTTAEPQEGGSSSREDRESHVGMVDNEAEATVMDDAEDVQVREPMSGEDENLYQSDKSEEDAVKEIGEMCDSQSSGARSEMRDLPSDLSPANVVAGTKSSGLAKNENLEFLKRFHHSYSSYAPAESNYSSYAPAEANTFPNVTTIDPIVHSISSFRELPDPFRVNRDDMKAEEVASNMTNSSSFSQRRVSSNEHSAFIDQSFSAAEVVDSSPHLQGLGATKEAQARSGRATLDDMSSSSAGHRAEGEASETPAAPAASDQTQSLVEAGALAGVGMLIGRDATTGKIFVNSVAPEGPACESGIKSGDQLLAVDGTVVEGLRTADVLNLIKGRKGTQVKLKLSRGDSSVLELHVMRAALGRGGTSPGSDKNISALEGLKAFFSSPPKSAASASSADTMPAKAEEEASQGVQDAETVDATIMSPGQEAGSMNKSVASRALELEACGDLMAIMDLVSYSSWSIKRSASLL